MRGEAMEGEDEEKGRESGPIFGGRLRQRANDWLVSAFWV